jgi:hypothetical protein
MIKKVRNVIPVGGKSNRYGDTGYEGRIIHFKKEVT